MPERLIDAGEITLWSEDFGDPSHPTLLLVAGGNLTALSWPDAFVELLVARGHHVIRYDHRDTGRSTSRDFARHPYGFDELTADAIAVLDGWDVDRAHVLGMSLGNTIGQLLALDHPERLLSIVVMLGGALDIDFDANIELAAAGRPSVDGLPLPTQRFLEVMALMQEEPADDAAALDQRVEKWRLLNGPHAPFDEQEFRDLELRAIAHSGTYREPIVHHFIPQPPTSRGAELASVTTPTLAIQALCDPAAPSPHAHHLAACIPGASVATVARMGHALPSAVHGPLADVVCSYTARVSARPRSTTTGGSP